MHLLHQRLGRIYVSSWLTKPRPRHNAAACIALLMGLVAGPIKFIVEFPYKWLPLCCSFLRQLLTRPTSCTSQTEGMIFPETLVPMKWKEDFWNIPRIALGLLKWSSLPRKPLCPLSWKRNRRKSRQSELWWVFLFWFGFDFVFVLGLTWEISCSTCHSQWAAGSFWPSQTSSLTPQL